MLNHPLFRLLSLSIFVLVVAGVAIQTLRWMGSQQQFAPADHPWMKESPWRVARLAPDHCDTKSLDELLKLGDRWLIWIDLQLTRERTFQIVCPPKTFELGETPTGPLLDSVVDRLVAKPVIFNVRAVDPASADKFLSDLRGFTDKKRDVGIASPSQSLLRTLRKKRPDWLYAADSSTWAKLKMFSTMGIETAADLWPDFFVASADATDPNFFSLSGAKEILRRKKVILLEWDGGAPVPQPWRESLQGVLTNRPKNISADTIFEEKSAN